MRRTLDIAVLLLDEGNFRTGTANGQPEAIRLMIDDQGENLLNLAKDIMEHGLNPTETLIVGAHPAERGQFIVFEGNRRVTALKCLDNPELAAGTPLHKDFRVLAPDFKKAPITNVECMIVADKKSAMIWIERRHINRTDGIGIDKWGPLAQARYENEFLNKVRKEVALLARLEERGLVAPDVIKTLYDDKLSVIQRIVKHGAFSDFSGTTIGTDGTIKFADSDETAGFGRLARMVQHVAENPSITTRYLNDRDQRDEFLKTTFGTSAVRSASQKGKASQVTKKSKAVLTEKGKNPRKSSAARETLAPTDRLRTIHVHGGPRLPDIYREARKISTKVYKEASSTLLRVFLELSTDAFLEETKVSMHKDCKAGKPWPDQSLSVKIKAAISALDPAGKEQKLKKIRSLLGDTSSPHSLIALHNYVHNRHFFPDPKSLRVTWDIYESYFMMLHEKLEESLKAKTSKKP